MPPSCFTRKPRSCPQARCSFHRSLDYPRCAAAPWVHAALADLVGVRWPEVRGFAWWQERWNNDGALGSDMLVQDDAEVAAAFRRALTDPDVVDAPLLR